ncbi:aminotransferase class I/II-fold pyridoxal phosphate-dependent enzyme [Roseibium denhamense]|uniref:8-amino-7-oxononanoate synthase n=1 Tax=Roseibium denhamense TaxID=76305 RepID=A0ABY1NT06_9HYPH|nr:aminotransferase class I/II-fold pyridoxal phosphate-dependent enzyme [Roseibium denhamense]MTI08096.1 aminotransferase class I/II-fold pyridoxal phosphate-dependent enzyme [Roseibium denhamense]SMP16277.1 8-amino-7-oxononanoate synthase [Roseibium denhamense]
MGADDRAKLMDSLKAGRRSARTRQSERPAATPQERPVKRKVFDFKELPQIQQLQMHRAAANMMGIENPFFRPHDGLAAGTSQIDNAVYDNFASYNYIGLNGHPEVTGAAQRAVEQYGTSVSASRVVAGERPFHRELEQSLARVHGVESAIVMVSGHATNVTTIGHLMQKGDLVLTDAYVHNSISEGVRLSGATRMNFPHNDLEALERLLSEHRHKFERTLIIVEGLYSMDGDFPDLKKVVRLKQSYDAWLMVDEAHSIGVLGKTGKGIAEHFGVDPNEVEVWMGTLSKTFSSCGGYIAGSKVLCDYLKVSAPGFVYSVGLSAPLGAAAIESCRLLEKEPERVAKLQSNGKLFLKLAKAAGLDTGPSEGYAVVPIIVGDSAGAATLSNRLLARGINALPIIFPAVPEKSARIRFFVTSEHTEDQIARAVQTTAAELDALRADGNAVDRLIKAAR